MNNPDKKKPPYPWAKAVMIGRASAPGLYAVEAEMKESLEILVVELADILPEDDKWSSLVPYMLFCILEGHEIESSVAAALGFLRFVQEGDLQHSFLRESLEGLVLPKEPS